MNIQCPRCGHTFPHPVAVGSVEGVQVQGANTRCPECRYVGPLPDSGTDAEGKTTYTRRPGGFKIAP